MRDETGAHGDLMNGIYRYQRWIYDATRKYYLLGRDRMIEGMDPAEDAHILEVACGTGRNLDLIDRTYPGRNLYGLDISSEMLSTARSKLGDRATLALGNACDFDSAALFGRPGFDHVCLSYSLSMIPDWRGALTEALRHLSENGTLHLVDFGDQAGLPRPFKTALYKWLEQFHVSPRTDLAAAIDGLPDRPAFAVRRSDLFRGYAQIARIRRVPNDGCRQP